MPISLQCPGCRAILTVSDPMAGQQARCASCATVFLVPRQAAAAAPTASAPVARFDFTPANPDAKFNFQAAPSPQDQSYRGYDGDPAGWRMTAAGLANVWLGSCIQLLAILGYLGGLVLVQVLTASAADGRGHDGATITTGIAVAYWLLVGGTLAGGALRVVGLGRCLAVPAVPGGKLLVAGALLGEVGALGSAVLLYLPFFRIAAFALLLTVGHWTAVLFSLILLLVFLRQLGVAFDSRLLPRRVLSFAIWVAAGPAAVGIVFVCGLAAPAFFGPGDTKKLVAFVFVLALLLSLILVPCILIFKYLNLLSLGGAEIRRRVPRG